MGPSITLNQTGLIIGDNTLLKPANLTFEAGKLHLLTGPNGAGKSSLLKSMMGLMPHSGDIHWQWPGKASLPAYIPQLAAFDATLPVTVEDYLHASIHTRAFFLKKSKAQKQRLQSLLEKVGLQDKTQRKLGQLSGGERQRAAHAERDGDGAGDRRHGGRRGSGGGGRRGGARAPHVREARRRKRRRRRRRRRRRCRNDRACCTDGHEAKAGRRTRTQAGTYAAPAATRLVPRRGRRPVVAQRRGG